MGDEKKWVKKREISDGERTDIISWGREKGFHDHEAVELHKDGDIDYYRGTHPDKKRKK